jgi:hypothetical protein
MTQRAARERGQRRGRSPYSESRVATDMLRDRTRAETALKPAMLYYRGAG